MSNIHYKYFRQEAIESLVAKDPKKHGLLINHTMGAGKTTTTLLLLRNFPKFPKYIVAPIAVHPQWIRQVKGARMATYETLDDKHITKKTVVIMDECHLWDGRAKRALQQKCFKLILLTGTPIETHISEMASLINLAAGRDIVPQNRALFEQRYYQINRAKATVYGYLIPGGLKPTIKFMKSTIINIAILGMIAALSAHVISYTVYVERAKAAYHKGTLTDDYKDFLVTTVTEGKTEVKTYEKQRYIDGKLDPVTLPIQRGFGYYLRNFARTYYTSGSVWSNFLTPWTSGLLGLHTRNVNTKEVKVNSNESFEDFYDRHMRMLAPGTTFAKVYINYEQFVREVTGDKGPRSELADRIYKMYPSSELPILKSYFGKTPSKAESESDRRWLWWYKFVREVFKGAFLLTEQLKRLDFAIAAFLLLTLLSILLTRLEKGRDILELNVTKLNRDIGAYIHTYNPFIINDIDMLTHFPKVTSRIMKYDLTGVQTDSLLRLMVNQQLPTDQFVDGPYRLAGRMASNVGRSRKFQRILDMHDGRKTLIWSNFTQGLENFRLAARRRGLRVINYAVDTWESSTADYILLPPHATEGVSLPGITRFHILEPCDNIAVYEQLKARVIRYKHTGVSPPVEIYTWVGEMRITLKRVTRLWQQLGMYQIPHLFAQRLKHNTSPDALTWDMLERVGRDYRAVSRQLSEVKREETQPNQCEPARPPNRRGTCIKLYEQRFLPST